MTPEEIQLLALNGIQQSFARKHQRDRLPAAEDSTGSVAGTEKMR